MPRKDDFEGFDSRPKRTLDKRKHHRNGYNDDTQDKRRARINFKNYMRELEEEQQMDFDDYEDDEYDDYDNQD